MNGLRHTATLLVVTSALAACASPEEKLIDRRHRLRASLDTLYGSYSGRPVANGGGDPDRPAGVVGRLLAEVDRSHFDEYCLAIGRGERPFTWSEKLEAFMRASEHARTCRDAAELAVEVARLEREVAPSPPR